MIRRFIVIALLAIGREGQRHAPNQFLPFEFSGQEKNHINSRSRRNIFVCRWGGGRGWWLCSFPGLICGKGKNSDSWASSWRKISCERSHRSGLPGPSGINGKSHQSRIGMTRRKKGKDGSAKGHSRHRDRGWDSFYDKDFHCCTGHRECGVGVRVRCNDPGTKGLEGLVSTGCPFRGPSSLGKMRFSWIQGWHFKLSNGPGTNGTALWGRCERAHLTSIAFMEWDFHRRFIPPSPMRPHQQKTFLRPPMRKPGWGCGVGFASGSRFSSGTRRTTKIRQVKVDHAVLACRPEGKKSFGHCKAGGHAATWATNVRGEVIVVALGMVMEERPGGETPFGADSPRAHFSSLRDGRGKQIRLADSTKQVAEDTSLYKLLLTLWFFWAVPM